MFIPALKLLELLHLALLWFSHRKYNFHHLQAHGVMMNEFSDQGKDRFVGHSWNTCDRELQHYSALTSTCLYRSCAALANFSGHLNNSQGKA